MLLAETLEFLQPGRGGLFLDCTVGLGGHAEALLEAAPGLRLLGLDRDPEALALAATRLARFGDRCRLVQGRFGEASDWLDRAGEAAAAGLLADFGVSSMQIDRGERGFSFRRDGPLDMRMGRGETTAAAVVNESSEERLTKIFREYGEERRARRIARAVVEARRERPITSTDGLREAVYRATGPRHAGQRIDPATRVFQALRIEVNQELEEIESLLGQVERLLEPDGRLVMISYHSLEDRRVKHALRDRARGEVDPITGRPRMETRVLEVLTKRPLRPSPEEVAANPRARSARLRAARRIGG